MSRARDFANLAGSADVGGITGRNMIINGNMAVAQRGTSVTGVSDSGYETVDRFRGSYNGTPDQLRVTHAQVADAPAGLTNSFKLTVTTEEGTLATDERVRLQQRIEAFNLQHLAFGTSSALPITLSFYVKSSIAGTYGVDLKNSDAGRSAAQSYTISDVNTWEKKTLTFAGDTAGAFNNDNGEGLVVSWVLAAGSDYTSGTLATAFASTTNANLAPSGQENLIGTDNATWQLTGVQLEVGDVATPFEHESFAATLQKCERYFRQSGAYTSAVPTGVGGFVSQQGMNQTSAQKAITKDWETAMRATPTMTIYDHSTTAGKWSAIDTSGGWTNNLNYTGIADQNAGGFKVYANGSTGYGYGLHYRADAEL